MKKIEKEFVDKMEKIFENNFIVKREVRSECKKSRIDIVLKLDENIYFGLECKIPDKKRGEEIGRYIKQSYIYSNSKFEVEKNIFKKIPIFICPPLSYDYFILNEEEIIFNNQNYHKDRHKKFFEHHTINGILGTFGIGEMRKTDATGGYIFSMSNKVIFSNKRFYQCLEKNGLHQNNYLFLNKKYKYEI